MHTVQLAPAPIPSSIVQCWAAALAASPCAVPLRTSYRLSRAATDAISGDLCPGSIIISVHAPQRRCMAGSCRVSLHVTRSPRASTSCPCFVIPSAACTCPTLLTHVMRARHHMSQSGEGSGDAEALETVRLMQLVAKHCVRGHAAHIPVHHTAACPPRTHGRLLPVRGARCADGGGPGCIADARCPSTCHGRARFITVPRCICVDRRCAHVRADACACACHAKQRPDPSPSTCVCVGTGIGVRMFAVACL